MTKSDEHLLSLQKALQQCELVQNMIDISISSLEGLRTKCATSNDLTQKEIRTLEVSKHPFAWAQMYVSFAPQPSCISTNVTRVYVCAGARCTWNNSASLNVFLNQSCISGIDRTGVINEEARTAVRGASLRILQVVKKVERGLLLTLIYILVFKSSASLKY